MCFRNRVEACERGLSCFIKKRLSKTSVYSSRSISIIAARAEVIELDRFRPREITNSQSPNKHQPADAPVGIRSWSPKDNSIQLNAESIKT
jgi:hypothetical protein